MNSRRQGTITGVPAGQPWGTTAHPRVWEAGRRVLARAFGELDGEAARALESRLLPLCRGRRRVVLDLRGVEYLDSNGVRALLRLHHQLQGQGGELRLVVHAGSRALRTLTLLQLDEHFAIHESLLLAWISKPPPARHGRAPRGRRCPA